MASVSFEDIMNESFYPSNIRGEISVLLGNLADQVTSTYNGLKKFRERVVACLNYILYTLLIGDSFPEQFDPDDIMGTIPDDIDFDQISDFLRSDYLDEAEVDFSRLKLAKITPEVVDNVLKSCTVSSVETPCGDELIIVNNYKCDEDHRIEYGTESTFRDSTSLSGNIHSHVDPDLCEDSPSQPGHTNKHYLSSNNEKDIAPNSQSRRIGQPTDSFTPTPKDHLFIRPPKIPRFDPDRIWAHTVIDSEPYTIYESLPLVPTNQNEISCTTNYSLFNDDDFMNLYPNRMIRTRGRDMYRRRDGQAYHEDMGLILRICDFSYEQRLDNVIRYPHLYKLDRVVDGEFETFYQKIEIDGELYRISDVWGDIDDTKDIPYNKEFVKEYVVRRYLLERDILGINHKYLIHGTLDPFLTLFTTPKHYQRLGYPDSLYLAKQCVKSRISYKQSRNAMLRKMKMYG